MAMTSPGAGVPLLVWQIKLTGQFGSYHGGRGRGKAFRFSAILFSRPRAADPGARIDARLR